MPLFDEGRHPRHPKGTPIVGPIGGGRFAKNPAAAGQEELLGVERVPIAEIQRRPRTRLRRRFNGRPTEQMTLAPPEPEVQGVPPTVE